MPKIILSKKGFDTTYGGYPSIINDKELISMPIPWSGTGFTYGQLHTPSGKNLFKIAEPYYSKTGVYDEKHNKIPFTRDTTCHPCPNVSNFFNRDNFCASFGQEGKPQGHLNNQGVGKDDIFLFFGLFKIGNEFKHIIYGYMKVGDIIKPQQLEQSREYYEKKYPWLNDQPHWTKGYAGEQNTIYVAEQNGYGAFAFDKELVLTRDGASTQRDWYVPALDGLTLSWGKKTFENGQVTLANGYGQEYVIQESDQAIKWANDLIEKHKTVKTCQ